MFTDRAKQRLRFNCCEQQHSLVLQENTRFLSEAILNLNSDNALNNLQQYHSERNNRCQSNIKSPPASEATTRPIASINAFSATGFKITSFAPAL
jgi:hypothetical protein